MAAVGAVFSGLIFILLFIQTKNIRFDFKKAVEDPGQIGDLVGGVSGPFIGLIGALLTFLAFWIQYKFNEFQTEKMERTRVEGLFYEMLKIHRANVDEITIKDASKSRRAFISMFKEFKFCYYALVSVYNEYKSENVRFKLDERQLVNISFITFFFGVGESSEEIVNSLLGNYEEIFRKKYYNKLSHFQEEWSNIDQIIKLGKDSKNSTSASKTPKRTIHVSAGNETDYSLTTGYKPFSGHLARLGHYYRHLFQTVYFIHKQKISGKEDYIRTLRAQISAHEQLLLYYNSLTVMGERWWTEGFLEKYGMVKNIPLPLANIGPKPTDKLKAEYFEWFEITKNL